MLNIPQKFGLASRRSALGLIAAAAGLPAVALSAHAATSGAPSAGLDADLFASLHAWDGASAAERAAADIAEEAEQRIAHVARPDALLRTAGDADLGLCIPESVGTVYDSGMIEAFRQAPRRHLEYVPYANDDGSPSDAITITRRTPWPEARARAEEIIAAFDAWRAAIAATREASGIDAAEEDYDRANDDDYEAMLAVVDTPANTLAGLAAKARAVERRIRPGAFSDLMDEQANIPDGPTQLMVVSVMRDLLRLLPGPSPEIA